MLLQANGEVVTSVVDGEEIRVVPVFLTGVQFPGKITAADILYVRVRSEQNETEDAALDRAERIASQLNLHYNRHVLTQEEQS